MPLVLKEWSMMIYFIVLTLVVSIALMNLVTAVIVESSFEQAQQDTEEKKIVHKQRVMHLTPQILDIFRQIDTDGDGTLTLSEVLHVNDELKAKLAEVAHLEEIADVFEILDSDGTGVVDTQEFVEGIMQFAMSDKGAEFLQMLKILQLSRMEQKTMRLDFDAVCEFLGIIPSAAKEYLGGRQHQKNGFQVTLQREIDNALAKQLGGLEVRLLARFDVLQGKMRSEEERPKSTPTTLEPASARGFVQASANKDASVTAGVVESQCEVDTPNLCVVDNAICRSAGQDIGNLGANSALHNGAPRSTAVAVMNSSATIQAPPTSPRPSMMTEHLLRLQGLLVENLLELQQHCKTTAAQQSLPQTQSASWSPPRRIADQWAHATQLPISRPEALSEMDAHTTGVSHQPCVFGTHSADETVVFCQQDGWHDAEAFTPSSSEALSTALSPSFVSIACPDDEQDVQQVALRGLDLPQFLQADS